MVILGVDPGSLRTGYGAIDTDGRRHQLIETGFIGPSRLLSLPERLRLIHAGLSDLIARLDPDVLAVEGVFHAANARSALVLGHVRGVVLLAGAPARLPLHQLSPPTAKQQITGVGPAGKGQGGFMGTPMLGLPRAGAAGRPP